MKLSKRETTMIVVGFVLVVVVAYVFYFFMPQMNKQQTVITQTLKAKSDVQTLKAKAAVIENFKKQIADLQNQLDEKSRNIPHGSNDAVILMYIRQLADKTNNEDVAVTFADVDKQPDEDANSPFVRRVVAVDLMTTYDKMEQLLAELNKVELFNSVQVISAKYAPVPTPAPSTTATDSSAAASGETATATPTPTPTPTSSPTPTPTSPGPLKAHIEVYFDSFRLLEGESPSEAPLTANVADRTAGMFPD